MNNFKDLLSTRRRELKMTQKELAEKLNVSDKTISKWETGVSYPEITLLKTIAKVLEIDVNELLGVEDMKDKDSNVTEKESYDYDVIAKYKSKIFLSIASLLSGIIISIISIGIENEDLQIASLGIGFIFIIFALIYFINNNITFRNFYSRKYFTREYDYVIMKYSQLLIILFTMPFYIVLMFSSAIDFSALTIFGIVNIIIFIITLVSIIFLFNIYQISNFKIKKDLLNKILGVLAILFFIFAFFILVFLPLSYILTLILINRKEYVQK